MKTNKHFDQTLKKEFDKTYKADISVQDIFEPDQLKPSKKLKTTSYYKWASITLSLVFIMVSVFIGIQYVHFNNNHNDFVFGTIYFNENNNILSSEEVNDIKNYCDYDFFKDKARYTEITDDITLYIYDGRKSYVKDSLMEIQNVYFYVFDFACEDCDVVIRIDNQEKVANKETRYGILKVLEETDEQNIAFTLSYDNITKEGSLKY